MKSHTVMLSQFDHTISPLSSQSPVQGILPEITLPLMILCPLICKQMAKTKTQNEKSISFQYRNKGRDPYSRSGSDHWSRSNIKGRNLQTIH